MPSPIGEVLLVSDGRSLRAVEFDDCDDRMKVSLVRQGLSTRFEERDDPQGFTSALRAYFDGRLDALEALPVEAGGTPFQRDVWAALRAIPVGGTRSYGGLAAHLGRPRASRAVGAANGLNPVAIVVPCHRVIGSNGRLTGYAGGVERKRWLLAHEGALQELPLESTAG
ncbi:MAG: methylated-DNA--[protein]-cysteine S-methyltransferase [Gammaproteobacteria bacterium]|nr:methylated-DNA--[protein]-cysteine S-methyltransferase [Gammaproteobacteria bacterium]